MAVIGINYDEGSKKKDLGYESVYVHHSNGEEVFKSGDFVKDWLNHNKWIAENLYETEPHFSNSSSVDHFIMDGAKFDSAYLKMKDDGETGYLVYYKDEEYDYESPGQEFFVKEGTTPTWQELKDYCYK